MHFAVCSSLCSPLRLSVLLVNVRDQRPGLPPACTARPALGGCQLPVAFINTTFPFGPFALCVLPVTCSYCLLCMQLW